MSTLDAFAPARPTPAANVFSVALGQFTAWNDRRMTVKMLSRLTDRELDDIGLLRADIAHWNGRR